MLLASVRWSLKKSDSFLGCWLTSSVTACRCLWVFMSNVPWLADSCFDVIYSCSAVSEPCGFTQWLSMPAKTFLPLLISFSAGFLEIAKYVSLQQLWWENVVCFCFFLIWFKRKYGLNRQGERLKDTALSKASHWCHDSCTFQVMALLLLFL